MMQIYFGPRATQLLSGDGFLTRWEALYRQDASHTPYQSPRFCVPWYRLYADAFEPVLVTSGLDDGSLHGLLPLAADRRTGALTYAGAHQAEYQTWLGPRNQLGGFLPSALGLLLESFPRLRMDLRFLPDSVGVSQTKERFGTAVTASIHRRPFVSLDRETGLRGHDRTNLKRLGRVGPVVLERITEASRLKSYWPEITRYCDLRHGAAHGILPFSSDPAKAPFHLALHEDGALHATVLRAGDEFLAAHLGLHDRAKLILGLLSHSPLHSKHSPGRLLLALLCDQARNEGITEFDLTPGGDPYKDSMASGAEEVHALLLEARPSILRRSRRGVVRSLRALVRNPVRQQALASALRKASNLASDLRMFGPSAVLGMPRSTPAQLLTGGSARPEVASAAHDGPVSPPAVVEALEVLSLYRRRAPSMPRAQDFHRFVWGILGAGAVVWPYRDEDGLGGAVWLIPMREGLALPTWLVDVSPRTGVLLAEFPSLAGAAIRTEALSNAVRWQLSIDPAAEIHVVQVMGTGSGVGPALLGKDTTGQPQAER